MGALSSSGRPRREGTLVSDVPPRTHFSTARSLEEAEVHWKALLLRAVLRFLIFFPSSAVLTCRLHVLLVRAFVGKGGFRSLGSLHKGSCFES